MAIGRRFTCWGRTAVCEHNRTTCTQVGAGLATPVHDRPIKVALSGRKYRSSWIGFLLFAGSSGCVLDWSSHGRSEDSDLDAGSDALSPRPDASGSLEPDAKVESEQDGAPNGCTPEACDDGLFCNGVELCVDGQCVSPGLALSDDIACTFDSCDEEQDKLVHIAQHDLCDDGEACNGSERCDVVLGCRPGTPNAAVDSDGDGYTPNAGDCNDCDALIGPAAMEIVGNGVDEDCDAIIATTPPSGCDSGLLLNSNSPVDGAAAVGLCGLVADGARWGLISASYTLPGGSPASGTGAFNLGHGIPPRFGDAFLPREGSAMLALSTGAARAKGTPSYAAPSPGLDKGYESSAIAELSNAIKVCPGVTVRKPHDAIALRLEVRVPSNTDRFAFDFAFFTADWPSALCDEFNDRFGVLLSTDGSALPAVNIALDPAGDVITGNSSLLDVCTCPGGPPCSLGARTFPCSKSGATMAGTGFDEGAPTGYTHAATGWRTAMGQVTPGSTITLQFSIFDAGDGLSDSSVLIDALRFLPIGSGTSAAAP